MSGPATVGTLPRPLRGNQSRLNAAPTSLFPPIARKINPPLKSPLETPAASVTALAPCETWKKRPEQLVRPKNLSTLGPFLHQEQKKTRERMPPSRPLGGIKASSPVSAIGIALLLSWAPGGFGNVFFSFNESIHRWLSFGAGRLPELWPLGASALVFFPNRWSPPQGELCLPGDWRPPP